MFHWIGNGRSTCVQDRCCVCNAPTHPGRCGGSAVTALFDCVTLRDLVTSQLSAFIAVDLIITGLRILFRSAITRRPLGRSLLFAKLTLIARLQRCVRNATDCLSDCFEDCTQWHWRIQDFAGWGPSRGGLPSFPLYSLPFPSFAVCVSVFYWLLYLVFQTQGSNKLSWLLSPPNFCSHFLALPIYISSVSLAHLSFFLPLHFHFFPFF